MNSERERERMTAFHDLREGLWRLRAAFEAHGLTPAIVELADYRQGGLLQSLLDQEHMFFVSNGMNDKGEPMRQVEINGVIVRWPAQIIAIPGGGFDHV